ncbi:hypothetical protein [Phenylobacterium sp.]|uniref:hypothetical protein n=1 Tax=Phenylobacterium sp. TaxID=1871053 RepID=UPI002FDB01E8
MATQPFEMEEQDQAEILDEDNVIGSGDDIPPAEMRTFEELPDVRDETTALGDADDDAAAFAEDLDPDELLALVEDERDGLTASQDPDARAPTETAAPMGSEDEVPLVRRDMAGAPDTDRADPARLESSRLSERQIDDLGYGQDDLG